MIEHKLLVCQNCGGHIDRQTMKCPYCDAEYERNMADMPIHFVVERPGVHRIRAEVMVEQELVAHHPEAATRFAMDKLRKGIADGLLDYMRVCTEQNPYERCQIIRGEVRVVDPTFGGY